MNFAPKIDLRYTPLMFSEGKSPAYEFIYFGAEGIGIQIEQPNGWRSFLANNLGYIYLLERTLQTGHDKWIAERIIELDRLKTLYFQP